MEELLAKVQNETNVHMMLLNDDAAEETNSLKSYHVQDPAQTNTKDLN